MKSINSILIALLALCVVGLSSCTKDDDDGPKKPSFQGVFKGSFINPAVGAEAEWVASSASAVHDTITDIVLISATNAAGDVITILLPDTAVRFHTLYQTTSGESIYEQSSSTEIATTRSNDVPGGPNAPSSSTIEITDNGANDGILKGNIHAISWYFVGEGVADDALLGLMYSGEFEVELKRRGFSTSGSLSANVNGAAFNATNVTTMGEQLIATNADMHSIAITVPLLGATVGTHEVGINSPYKINYSQGSSAFLLEGTITITDNTKMAPKGTFQASGEAMMGEGSVEITNGSFSF